MLDSEVGVYSYSSSGIGEMPISNEDFVWAAFDVRGKLVEVV